MPASDGTNVGAAGSNSDFHLGGGGGVLVTWLVHIALGPIGVVCGKPLNLSSFALFSLWWEHWALDSIPLLGGLLMTMTGDFTTGLKDGALGLSFGLAGASLLVNTFREGSFRDINLWYSI